MFSKSKSFTMSSAMGMILLPMVVKEVPETAVIRAGEVASTGAMVKHAANMEQKNKIVNKKYVLCLIIMTGWGIVEERREMGFDVG